MDRAKLRAAIEAVLFAGGEPLPKSRLYEIFEMSKKEIEPVVKELQKILVERGSGIKLVELDDFYQLCTSEEYAEYIRKALEIKKNAPLSQAAMEVLAIVAYHQPVTKAYVEQIRGVDSSGVFSSLIRKNLLEEKGRLELPGRPLLYGTTSVFLRSFNISNLGELPAIPEKQIFSEMENENEKEQIAQGDKTGQE